MTGSTYARLAGLMLLITIVLSVVMLQFDWFGEAASTQAGPIDTLFDVTIVVSSFVFAVVIVMFGYAIWKFRVKPGDESDGEPIHGNTRLEIAWTVIPTVIVLLGAIYSWIVLDDIEAVDANAMPINVTGQQFKWTFEYPDAQMADGTPLSSNELHVVVDRQIEVTNTALDVLHSFWVPEWRIKRDLVPAGAGGDEIDNQFVVTPSEEGEYSVICTELCGLGHATMRAPVIVESQEEFDAWVAEQSEAQGQQAGSASSAGSAAGGGGT